MNKIEQTITSIEVAEMVGKEHSKLLRDIRNYVEQFNQSKIGFVDFFTESTYKDNKGEIRPCYNVTKKGCEFIAHKLTGTRGTEFTARYINRFHDMEEHINSNKPRTALEQLQLQSQASSVEENGVATDIMYMNATISENGGLSINRNIANAQAYIANKATYTKDVTEFENKLNELVTEFSK